MVIDELKAGPNYRLQKVLDLLESLFGVTIDFGSATSTAELQSIYEAYGLERSRIIQESAYNTCSNNPDYTKAVLIQEAIHIFLSEVAPKRIRKKYS